MDRISGKKQTSVKSASKLRAFEQRRREASLTNTISSRLDLLHDRLILLEEQDEQQQSAPTTNEITTPASRTVMFEPKQTRTTSWSDAVAATLRNIIRDRGSTLSGSAYLFYSTVIVCSVLISIIALLLYSELLQINRASALPTFLASPLAFHEFKTIAYGVVLGALGWTTIRLFYDRYKMIARREQHWEQYQIDVQRADYIIEMLLRLRTETDGAFPPVLLKQLSSGLFGSAGGDEDDKGGDGALQALLSRAASLKLGPSGVELEIDKSGLRKAINEIGRSSTEGA